MLRIGIVLIITGLVFWKLFKVLVPNQREKYFVISSWVYTFLVLWAVNLKELFFIVHIGLFVYWIFVTREKFQQYGTKFFFVVGSNMFHILVLKELILTLIVYVDRAMAEINTYNYLAKDIANMLIVLGVMIVVCTQLYIFYSKNEIYYLKNNSIIQKKICFVQIIINKVLLLHNKNYYVTNSMEGIAQVIILMGCMFLYYYVLNYYILKIMYQDIQEKNKFLEDQITKQLKYCEIQKDHIEDLKSFKHDYKSTVEGLGYLVKAQEWNRVQSYLEEMNMYVLEYIDRQCQYSNHPLVQAIFSSVEEDISEIQIQLDIQVMIPECIRISDIDLCRVIKNLVQNAIEACEHVAIHRRYIRMRTYKKRGGIIIEVENPFEGERIIRDNQVMSTKRKYKDKGYGLHNIRNIIEKNHGIVNIEISHEEKMFKVAIYMPYKNLN